VISYERLKRVFDPQTRAQVQQKPRILIVDGFITHETIEAIEFCLENNIILCRIPSHTSHKLQPCDVRVFSLLKTAYRELVERLYRGGAAKVGKEHFASLYSRAREVAFTPRNIRAGWTKSGLIPFNPDRVLSETPKPPEEPSILKQEVNVVSRPNDGVAHTPVTSEALTLLCSLVEQDTNSLDERGKYHVEKLRNAAKKWAAECAFLLDENKLLFEQNIESNVRKSTRSTVVGKAKVMSLDALEKKKAARTTKEQAASKKEKRGQKTNDSAPEAEEATAGRGKRGRKRKSCVSEADTAASAKAEVARVSDAPESKAPVAWMSEAQDPARASVAQPTEAQELAIQALAARMAEGQAAEDEIAARGMKTYCSVLPLG
jgi:DDE superfamily endonuclease